MHFQIFDSNSKYNVYKSYYFSTKIKEKIRHIKFLRKVVIVYSTEKTRFDYKNNYKCSKLAHFLINIIGKVN